MAAVLSRTAEDKKRIQKSNIYVLMLGDIYYMRLVS